MSKILDILDRVIVSSPVPVFRKDPNKFVHENINKFIKKSQPDIRKHCMHGLIAGCFVELTRVESKRIGYPQNFILLDQLPISESIEVMLHEIGHAMCSRNKCKCTKMLDRDLSEYHANKYALQSIVNHKWNFLLLSMMTRIECDGHAKRMKRTKLWKEAKKFLEKNYA